MRYMKVKDSHISITANQILIFTQKYKKVSNGCWEWQGAKQKPGKRGTMLPYGFFRIGSDTDKQSRMVHVHRLSYFLFNGVIPDGMLVCHTCDNPTCCNPDHLVVGTHKDNHNDMVARGRDKHSTNIQWMHVSTRCKVCHTRVTPGVLGKHHRNCTRPVDTSWEWPKWNDPR